MWRGLPSAWLVVDPSVAAIRNYSSSSGAGSAFWDGFRHPAPRDITDESAP